MSCQFYVRVMGKPLAACLLLKKKKKKKKKCKFEFSQRCKNIIISTSTVVAHEIKFSMHIIIMLSKQGLLEYFCQSKKQTQKISFTQVIFENKPSQEKFTSILYGEKIHSRQDDSRSN